MKHTSIRLTDEHATKIKATGKKPSIVVREALDAYFGIPPEDSEPLRRLIDEHVRNYHSTQNAHIASTEGETQRAHNVLDSARNEHIVPKMECKKEGEAIICTAPLTLTPEARTALAYILGELEAGREPTSREAAEKVGLTPTGLGMMLSKVGIKSQNTRRNMQSVKIYTKPMKGRIKAVLAGKTDPSPGR